VRQLIKEFTLDLYYLLTQADLVEGAEMNGQVPFRTAFEKRNIILQDTNASFVDPGVTQRFTYLARLPLNATYVLAYFQFKYPNLTEEYHVASKAFRVGRQLATTAEPAPEILVDNAKGRCLFKQYTLARNASTAARAQVPHKRQTEATQEISILTKWLRHPETYAPCGFHAVPSRSTLTITSSN